MKTTSLRHTLVLLVLITFASTIMAAEAPKVSWKVSGELEEACSCHPACPCWFKSPPSRMTCDGAQIIFITKGHYGKVSLDGLAVAQFVQSPEHQTMFESFGNWNFDYVYIDEKANDEQRAALKELAAHFFPPAAKTREFRYVAITREIKGEEHTTIVGQYAVCSGHLIGGGFFGHPKVSNPPLADPTHKEFMQGETTKLTYSDAGQGWEYKNSNYMFNKFTVDNKEYEKHEADVAKMMSGKM
ncbi:MAG TPA: DUF1326 domain-containing protein [Candidatus Acidoferrales bacterium]|jgi:hypothetical protein|nr:DUF1326 domain-containing protein [Candidatus Acidoferrales bacterium]